MLGSWPQGLAALRGRGVTLHAPGEEAQTFPVAASANPADFAGARWALVLVKAWQTERAAQQLRACLAEDGLALTLQNGLGNREILAAALGEPRVAQGVTTTGASLRAPGEVQAGGEGRISLGAHPRLAPLAAALQGAGFQVEPGADLNSLVWSKLAVNAAINPLAAVLGLRNGDLLERPSARSLMGALAREVAAVAEARGVPLTTEDPAAAAEGVARRTADNLNSMLQDVQRGAPTEIDAICGAVVRAGQAAGVPTPANAVMLDLVKARVEGARAKG